MSPLWVVLCVCVAAFTPLCNSSVLLHTCRVSILVNAMPWVQHKTMVSVHVLHAPLGVYRFAGMGSFSGWSSLSGSCTASSSWSLLFLSRLPSVPLAHWQQHTLPWEPTPTHQHTARELLPLQFPGIFPYQEPESEEKPR